MSDMSGRNGVSDASGVSDVSDTRTEHTYRVLVRGTWDGLTEEARARLLAEAGQQGLDQMKFTPEGTLSYDRALKHFTFRCVVVSDAGDGEELAAALAEEQVETRLKELGYGYRDLKSSATDMDTMKINWKPSSRR